MSDLYDWQDGRLFVNGEYRAILESVSDDGGICEHVTSLCNEASEDVFGRGYKAGMSTALRMLGDAVDTLKEANDE